MYVLALHQLGPGFPRVMLPELTWAMRPTPPVTLNSASHRRARANACDDARTNARANINACAHSEANARANINASARQGGGRVCAWPA
jgi:hypothetical protein